MQTITHNGSNILAYIFADDVTITATAKNTTCPDLVIMDMNTGNSTIHTGVTPPADWKGGKYLFDGTDWSANSDWVTPVDHVKIADEAAGGE